MRSTVSHRIEGELSMRFRHGRIERIDFFMRDVHRVLACIAYKIGKPHRFSGQNLPKRTKQQAAHSPPDGAGPHSLYSFNRQFQMFRPLMAYNNQ
jgi:hypothetical protein